MFTLLVASALAGDLSKAECKTFTNDLKAAYPSTVWALKDLPAKTGFTMYAAWIAPIAEVKPSGYTIDASAGTAVTVGSATSTWFGVRPNDQLKLDDVDCDDGAVIIDLVGTGTSKGHDTKVKLLDAKTYAEIKPTLDLLISATDPVAADWAQEVKTGITNRMLVNGMTKKQAYLVVGEPAGSSTKEEGGKKIEIWNPRQTNGMRIGYGATVSATGYPAEIRFEDGVLVGLATGSGGGVSLD